QRAPHSLLFPYTTLFRSFVVPFMHSTGSFAKAQGYKNPEADRLIEQAARETDPKKREQLYFRLQEIAYQDVPTIYLIYRAGFVRSEEHTSELQSRVDLVC